uniref:CCHC-type domain-containing protein n=1 Tax=Tanacetum cinerariifolium TaxID=118510 RepID=A0A699GYP1_TANCI|nr:hypothetical protein [Tanacetum cinerariifolium]
MLRYGGIMLIRGDELTKNQRLRQRVRVPLVASPHLPEPLPLQHLKQHLKPPLTTSAVGNTKECVDNAPRCYNCSGLGHYARDCPNLKTLAFVRDDAYPIYNTNAELELDEPGEELVYPDHGEELVIQRVLNMAVSKSIDDSSFKKDGVNITLVPFDSYQTQVEGFDLLIKKTGFEGLMKTSPYVFTLVVVEENKIISEAPLQVQPLLREFADVIFDDIPTGLPAMRDIQHCIDFIPGSAIPNRPAYRMNPKEFAKLQRQVSELLEKRLIQESMSSCAVPALLLHGFIIFYKIDLRSGYHQTEMRPGDEWKTTFKTQDGLYEWMVMPFELSNAPSTFMCLMNQVFKPFIGHFVVVYFDDILIYSSSLEQHLSHLRGIKIDPAKLETIISWPTPFTIHGIHSFHGEAAKAFDILKAKVIEAPILALPNFDEVFQVERDESGVGIGGVLSGLAGHFRRTKTLALLCEHFYQPKMERDVNRHLERCHTCHIDKTQFINAGLYTPLSVPITPWEDVSLDFVLARLYFVEILKLHGVPNTLTSDRDVKFNANTSCSTCNMEFLDPNKKKEIESWIRDSRIIDSLDGSNEIEYFDTFPTMEELEYHEWLLKYPKPPWVKDTTSIIDHPFGEVIFGKPFARNTGLVYDQEERTVTFKNDDEKFTFKMPYKMETSNHIDFKNINTDSIPPFILRNNDDHRKTYYSDSLTLGSAYKDDESISKEIQHLMKLEREAKRHKGEVTIWKAFGGNTRDLGSFGEETDKITDLHQIYEELLLTEREDGVVVHFGKLKPRGDGPFRVLKKINNNAYKIELPGHYNVSATFNVVDLSPYKGDSDDNPESGSSLFKKGMMMQIRSTSVST